MFTLELYKSSVASGALNQVTSVYTGVTPTLNSGFQVPQLNQLGGVLLLSANARRAQIQAPSLRTQPYPDFVPVNRGTAFESPTRFVDMMRYPIGLQYTEEVDLFAVTGTTETMYGAILLSDGASAPVPPSGVRTVHATSATTLTAGAFTTVPLTLDQALPAGFYSLIGARLFTATGIFFRVIPAMGPLWQPGGIACQTYDQLTPDGQRYGGWGEWLRFQQNVLPSVNVFATAADTAQEAWLDLVKIG